MLLLQKLLDRLTKNEVKNIHELKVDSSFKMTSSKWKKINEKYTPKLLIIWLDKEQSYQILDTIQQNTIQQIYLSSRMMNRYYPELLRSRIT